MTRRQVANAIIGRLGPHVDAQGWGLYWRLGDIPEPRIRFERRGDPALGRVRLARRWGKTDAATRRIMREHRERR